jgi:hypothetical protein
MEDMMTFTPNPGYTLDTTKINTWFERDRMYVGLFSTKDVLLVEWWDGAVAEAVEDGFLKIDTRLGRVINNGGTKLHETALAYYREYLYPKKEISIKPEPQPEEDPEEEDEENEEEDEQLYEIVRFYQRSDIESEIINTRCTLEEAQDHCNNPETSWKTCTTEEGEERTRTCGYWFDGYRKI